ncbi:MAG TPA: ferric reductase-like transmembrane domain-containing protein [Ktedonobacterales bacterium]|nr:ferric reductase-like transmembrane domain-containing protein [Ktedonobacterales bacterium]
MTLSLASVAATANPTLWYVTRASAVSAYVLLSASVVLGLMRTTRRQVPWWLDEAHRYLALLVAGFVVLHLLSLAFDPLIPFAPLSLLLPVAEPYRPFASALGVLGLYCLVAVAVSSWLRRYIAHATWRTLHYGSFAVFVLVTAHGLLAGSDSGEAWMRLVYLGAAILVALLTIRRLAQAPATAPARPARARR